MDGLKKSLLFKEVIRDKQQQVSETSNLNGPWKSFPYRGYWFLWFSEFNKK